MVVQAAVKPSLTLKRRLKAPPAKVFAAFTDPEKVKRWIGPGEMTGAIGETDARAGGRYRWVMRSPDGQRAQCRRGLSRGGPQRKAGLHLGVEGRAAG